MDRVRAKEDAKAQLKGNWGLAIAAFLVAQIIVGVGGMASAIPVAGWVVTSILSGVMALGIVKFSLLFTTSTKPELTIIFAGFQNFLKAWLLSLVVGIFTLLWSLLLFIPGIIKGLSYSMATFILAENPDMQIMEAINRSKEITKGQIWNLFVMYLSFLGWGIVAMLTLGIGYLWLVPYMNITVANVYLQLKNGQTV